jgi:hypothetical protein
MTIELEYRVIPVTRYHVTRYAVSPDGKVGSSSTIGEYGNAGVAYQVAYACCKAEHERLGYPPGDERVQYPREPVLGEVASA